MLKHNMVGEADFSCCGAAIRLPRNSVALEKNGSLICAAGRSATSNTLILMCYTRQYLHHSKGGCKHFSQEIAK